jgi:thiol-disulfide isomerase/thioredoxin
MRGIAVPVKVHFLLFILLLLAAGFGALKYQNDKTPKVPVQTLKLPVIEFYDKSGQKVTLESFRGKVVLVNLWATWCPPCVAELPSLNRLQERLSDKHFKVVAISMDRTSLQDVGRFLKEKGGKNLDVYWDKDRQVPLKWRYDGLPTSILLRQDGTIVAQYSGPYVWDKPPLLRKVNDLLPK